MHIVELESQKVKISFIPTHHQLKTGDFISFSEGDLLLIAQIYKINSTNDETNIADMNFILTCKKGKIRYWDGQTISSQATISKADKIIIEKFINNNDTDESFCIGEYLSYPNSPIYLNNKNFLTPILVGFEKTSDNEKLMEIISHQCINSNQKLLVLDFKGNINLPNAEKIVAGYHSKLPLNNSLLENISNRILLDVSLESKIVIEDILTEIAEYTKESKNGFIGLSQLINVVESTFKKSKIQQLMFLTNKLIKLQRLSIFADTKEEVFAVFDALSENNIVIYDLSEVPLEWHKDFFNSILELNNSIKENFYLYATLDEQNSDNKIINNLLFKAQRSGIKSIMSSNYKYLPFDNIYDFSQNVLLFRTEDGLTQQKNISEIIKTLPDEVVLISGKLTNNIPVCAKLQDKPVEIITQSFDSFETEKFEESIGTIERNLEKEDIYTQTPEIDEDNSDEIEEEQEEEQVEETTIDIATLDSALAPEPSISIKMPEEPTTPSMLKAIENIEEKTIQPIQNLFPEEDEEIEQTEENEIPEETELVEPEINLQEEEILEENNVAEDEKIENNEELDLFEADAIFEEISQMSENEDEFENISLEDLDFVENNDPTSGFNDDDDLLNLLAETEEANADNSLDEDIDLDDLLGEATSSQSLDDIDDEDIDFEPAQSLPIYSADYEDKQSKKQLSEPEFQEGDLVKHQKYGVGTIKKITAHGDKYLCHINFDDFGRRLLDPEISQIEKL